MPYSQNGFSANSRALIASYLVKGTGTRLPVRKGDVATVLLYVAQRFHKEVEPLRTGWCWGYAERPIRGSSSTLSNHASGTAIDLNAPIHWLGQKNTFSSKQRVALRKILNSTKVNGKQVVRWGGDYIFRKDEMHFEVVGTPSEVKALADRIKNGGSLSTAIVALRRVLKVGSNGKDVKLVQARLNKLMPNSTPLKVDGDFGPATAKRVYAFKKSRKFKGVLPNKEVGSGTAKLLGLKWTGK